MGYRTHFGLSIDPSELADGAVITVKIADDAVTQDKIADDAVTQDKIANNAVGLAQLAHGTAGKYLGFDGSGVPAEVDAGGMDEVGDDMSPQLGGNLDAQGNALYELGYLRARENTEFRAYTETQSYPIILGIRPEAVDAVGDGYGRVGVGYYGGPQFTGELTQGGGRDYVNDGYKPWQRRCIPLRGETTDTNYHDLLVDSEQELVVPQEKAWAFVAYVGCNDDSGYDGLWRIEGVIENDGGSVTISGPVVTELLDEGSDKEVTAEADTVHDALRIKIKGGSAACFWGGWVEAFEFGVKAGGGGSS